MRSGVCLAGISLLAAACAQPQADPPLSGVTKLADACVDIGLDQGCGVVAAGLLNDGPGGKRLYWQIQDGASADLGVSGGLVVFEKGADGALKQLIADREAWGYEAPRLLSDGEGGPTLLVAHGTSRGMSGGPHTIAWQWTGNAWSQLDLDTWHGEAEAKLGAGSIQNTFRIDFENMIGVTPLWRSGDGRCCPSAGWARIDFEVREGALHVVDASAIPAR